MDDGWKLGEQDLLDAIIYDLTEDNYVLESISLNGGVGVSAIKTDELGGRVGGVSIRCDDLLAGYCGVWKAVRDAEEPG